MDLASKAPMLFDSMNCEEKQTGANEFGTIEPTNKKRKSML